MIIRKRIAAIILLVMVMFLLSGCVSANITETLSTKTSDTKAYIHVNGHTVVIDVEKYLIGSNGTVSIFALHGTIYKTHLVNVVMIQNGN